MLPPMWRLLVIVMGLWACQRAGPDALTPLQILAEPPPATRTLSYASSGIEMIDPAKVNDTAGHHLMLNVFEGLYTYNRGAGPPLPAMAASAQPVVSADGKTWTVQVRRDLQWSDGTPLDARDLVWSWQRALDPKTASRSAPLLWWIQGAKAFSTGQTSDPRTVGVRAPDPYTLQLQLEAPTPFLPQLLCEMPYVPVPRHVIEKWGDQWTRPEHIVSNGPFVLAQFEPRRGAVLRRNKRYVGDYPPFFDQIEALVTDSEDTALQWYEVGRTQWHGDIGLPAEKIAALRQLGRPDLHSEPKLCTYYLSLRVDQPPLDDVRVRRALALAVDRQRLVLHVLRGGEVAAANAVPDLFAATLGYHAQTSDGFDPDLARQLLAEAGHPRGKGLAPIVLQHNTGEMHRAIAEFVQRSWHEHLGVDVQLHNLEWGTLLQALRTGQFQIGRSSWCADYPDPLTFLDVFGAAHPANYPGYHSAGYDAALATAKHATESQARNQALTQAETLLARDAPILPLYHYTGAYLLKPFVLGYLPHPQDMHPLKFGRWATPPERAQLQRGQPVVLGPLQPVGH